MISKDTEKTSSTIECSEQWHVLNVNMGNGKCSECGKIITELNYLKNQK
jgi:hypothetical protein